MTVDRCIAITEELHSDLLELLRGIATRWPNVQMGVSARELGELLAESDTATTKGTN